jgi:acyl-CoA dehydrogenase
LLKEMEAARDPRPTARRAFDRAIFGHLGYLISNAVRAWMLGVTGALITRSPVRGATARYFRQMKRLCAAFCLTSDLVLLLLGGRFKFKEKLSGRMADALIHLYMGSAVLKRFEDEGRPEEDLPLVTWAMDDSLHRIQESLLGVLANLPLPGIGRLAKWLIFPLGSAYPQPSDRTGKDIARLLTTENASRDRLIAGVYISDEDDASGQVHTAFHLVLMAAKAESAVRNALKETVTFENYRRLVQKAVESGVITEEQATTVRLAQEAARAVIEVDEFTRAEIEGYEEAAFRPAANSG